MSDTQDQHHDIPDAIVGKPTLPKTRFTLKGIVLGVMLGAFVLWLGQLVWPHVTGLFPDDSAERTVQLPESEPPLQLIDEWFPYARRLVLIKNPQGVTNCYDKAFAFEDDCMTDEGGVARPVAVDGDRVLMRFRPPSRQSASLVDEDLQASLCPDGTLFFLTREGYGYLLEERQDMIREAGRRVHERETVERLTQQAESGSE